MNENENKTELVEVKKEEEKKEGLFTRARKSFGAWLASDHPMKNKKAKAVVGTTIAAGTIIGGAVLGFMKKRGGLGVDILPDDPVNETPFEESSTFVPGVDELVD